MRAAGVSFAIWPARCLAFDARRNRRRVAADAASTPRGWTPRPPRRRTGEWQCLGLCTGLEGGG